MIALKTLLMTSAPVLKSDRRVSIPRPSSVMVIVQAPMGTSVNSGCNGWPSQTPLRKSLRPVGRPPGCVSTLLTASATVALGASSHS